MQALTRLLQKINPKTVSVRKGPKIGRNEKCPCGSGLKFKRCCGK